MHPLPSKLVFSTGQNQPEGVQNCKISLDGNHASALIFGGPESVHKMSQEGFAALQWLFTPWADSVNAVEASGVMSKLRCGGESHSIGGQ